PCSATGTSAKRSSTAAGITCWRSRTTSRGCTSTSPRCSPSRRPFPPYQQRRWESEQATCTTHDKGHGRVERRALTATPVLREYLDWPQARQVFQSQRERRLDGGRVRSGSAPQVLAATRSALLHLLQGAHPRGFAAALRRFAAKPLEAAAL